MGNKLVQSAAIALTVVGTNGAFAADPSNGHTIVKTGSTTTLRFLVPFETGGVAR